LTLRQAIAQCNAATPDTFHTITFASGLWGGTLTLEPSNGELSITKDVHIGSSSMTSDVTVQRDSTSMTNHRIFHIGDSMTAVSVELHHLVIKNGKLTSGDGAGILSEGGSNVYLLDCTVRNNTTDGNGGGIAVTSNNSILHVWDSNISYNESTENNGGGVYILGAASNFALYDTTVSHNESGFNGGGIYTTAGTNILDNVLVQLNKTQNKGGGIYAAPSGSGSISLRNGTTIDQNECLNSDTSQRKGGGIYIATGTLSMGWIGTTTISNNTATTGNGVYQASDATVSKDDENITWTNNSLYDEDNP
jgi:predicted outer membrane repeat protein